MKRPLPQQSLIGLLLAFLILGAWAGLHIWAVFFYDRAALLPGLAAFLLLSWLSVGLFILAHDAMHRSLAPAAPRLEAAIGATALFLYGGFSFRRLFPRHHDHHRHVGTEGDPDFSTRNGTSFWRWFREFLQRYFGWREFGVMTLRLVAYLLLGASWKNVALFFVLPAWASALQLFYFGTYLPHRPGTPFADEHLARSNAYHYLASLFSCFHFGYHHEHHRKPYLPWWALPGEYRRGLHER